MHFNELNIIQPILKAIEEEGYTTPTPIQEQAIPLVLDGNDLMGCAQTGTGKTAAFSIPILQLLSENKDFKGKRKIRALIVTPTRELAIQIGDSLKAYGRHCGLNSTVIFGMLAIQIGDSLKAYGRHCGLNSTVIFGGVNQNPQVNTLKNGVDILVATPGRLLDLMMQGFISIRDVEIFVLDEADRMLDMGFIHDVNKLIKALPDKRQNLFFSATMAPEILKLAGTILQDPVRVEVTPVSSTAEMIKQSVYFVDKNNKNSLLVDILNEVDASSVLVFTKTKHGADKVVKHLAKHNIKADAIHGNKSQNNRQRALSNFKDKTIRVLVATDIAARGIDVEEMEMVINFELPNISETYVHRIGRTGRAGNKGTAVSFCDFEEKAYLKDIEKLIHLSIPVVEGHPYPMQNFTIEKKEQRQRPPRDQRGNEKKPKPTVDQRVDAAKKKGKKTWYGKRDRY